MSSNTTAHSLAARRIATVFGLGDRLPAPGTTAGSFPAALIWLGLMAVVPGWNGGLLATLAGVVLFTAIGIWASGKEVHRRGQHDPGPVVIDEVAGQWMSYFVALPFVNIATPLELVLFAGAGFFVFRFFDVVKPWPVRRFERIPGGLGVVVDDLAAAIYSGVVLAIGWNLVAVEILR